MTVVLCIGMAELTWAAKPPALRMYRNADLRFQLMVPKRWEEVHSVSAVGFKSPADGPRASLGVLKSVQRKIAFEQAARKEYKRQKRPKVWDQHLIRIGDLRAVQVQADVDPAGNSRLLMYFVESPDGYYLIECIAPAKKWLYYRPLFKILVESFSIL